MITNTKTIQSAVITVSISRSAGGLFESVRRLAQTLVDNGVTVSVLSSSDKFSCSDISSWLPLYPTLFPIYGPKFFSFSPGLCKAMTNSHFDIIHCHGLWTYSSLANLLQYYSKRTPYIISPHGMLDSWAIQNSQMKKKVANFLYEGPHLRNASCIRSLCKAESEAIRQYGLSNAICQIPNGIDLPDPETKYSLPPWSGAVPDDNKILLYLGRIHPKKGIANLIDAWSILHSKNNKEQKRWSLVVAGWDQAGHEDELRRKASSAGLGDIIHFIGPQFGTAKEACYHHADAFILPSFSEGLPMVVLEAWAYGLPVIMTPQCNIPEGFTSGAALHVDPNAEDIARCLRQFFELTDAERMTMGEKGLALVKERFTWLKVAAEMKAVYEWVLGRGPQPACVRMD
jgi:glycosyltransferase involved in cell wall biosynthesis